MKFRAIVSLALLSSSVEAWSGPAHLLTARIAEEVLKKESPETIEQVKTILSSLEESDPTLVVEDKHPFTECVTFADNIKYHGGMFQSDWHFKDQPYLDQGGSLDDFSFKYATYNIVDAMISIRDWFNQEGDYANNHYVVKTVAYQMGTKSYHNALSNALRFFMHFMGDIHQPLHMVSRVDAQYPSGDKGGNAFPLPYHYQADELHAVWDHVIYEFHKTLHVPLSDEDWDAQGVIAQRIMAANPASGIPNIESLDPNDWSKESFDISASVVYKGVKENEKVPQEYIDAMLPVAERRIATGGYRLANVLKHMDLTTAWKKSELIAAPISKSLTET